MLAAIVLLLAMASTPLQLGIQSLDKRDFAGAVAHLEQAAKTAPAEPSIWVLLAQARFGAGQQEAALTAAAKAAQLGEGDADVQHGLAFVYAEFAHDFGKAAAFEERYAQTRPDDKAVWSRVATLYLRANMADRAIEPASIAWRAADTPASRAVLEEAYFRVSQKHLVTQDFNAAAAVLDKARLVLKDSAQLELALGVAFYGQRKFAEAVGQFLRTMDLAPDVQQSYVFAGKILEHAGTRLPDLIKRFELYRERNPESHLGYLLGAKALLTQRGDAGRALSLARQAVAKKSDDPEAQVVLGTLLDERGEHAEAAEAFEKSIALRAGDASAHYRLARTYLKLGRKEDAARERAIFDKLSEDPPDERR